MLPWDLAEAEKFARYVRHNVQELLGGTDKQDEQTLLGLADTILSLATDVRRLQSQLEAAHRTTTNTVQQKQHPYHDDLHEIPWPPADDEGD